MTNEEIGARIRECRTGLNLTLADVAAEIGVNTSTISRYERGAFEQLKLPVIEAIASALHVNPAYLVGRTDDPIDYEDPSLLNDVPLAALHEWQSQGLSDGEIGRRAIALHDERGDYATHASVSLPSQAGFRIGLLYDKASERDRTLVDTVLAPYDDGMLEQPPMTEAPRATKIIPFEPKKYRADHGFAKLDVYDDAATAGFGNYLSQPTSHIEQYPASMIPAGTDFGVRISGDSMEPVIPDGSTAFVQSRSAIEPGDIGIFLFNGQSYCKQLVIDRGRGQVRLHSLNPNYEDMTVGEYDDLRTLGRVLGSY